MVCGRVSKSNKTTSPLLLQTNLEAALDSELTSERALQEVILDDGHNDKIRQFLAVTTPSPRRRRSSVSADHLILKQIGPSLGAKVLDATLREINKAATSAAVQLIPSDNVQVVSSELDQSSNKLVRSWFQPPQRVLLCSADRTVLRENTVEPEKQLTSSRGLFFAVLAQERFKKSTKRLNKDKVDYKVGSGTKPCEITAPTTEFSYIPTLDKVQEHIERVRVIMGQSPTTPGRGTILSSHGRRDTEQKQKLTAHKVYKVPFPALKRRRDSHLAREKYIHSLIMEG
ncbi:hypothetical protein ACHWQZ_G013105 [Mnemiopsis leidyi]